MKEEIQNKSKANTQFISLVENAVVHQYMTASLPMFKYTKRLKSTNRLAAKSSEH